MTDRPIRVLQVVQRFYPELGGLETHVAEVTSRLEKMPDIEITILTTDRSGTLPAEEMINGVRVLRRRSYPEHKDYYFSPGLVGVIRRGGWDLVHLQGGQTFVPLIGMVAALSAGIPYLLTFHTGGYSTAGRSLMGRVRTQALRPLLSRAARLIAVSRFEKKAFVADTRIDADHFVVINNGGALPAVPPDVRPIPGIIVSSGRLEKYKGHHRAIEALPLVRQSIPGARLTILGGGPYEAELHALADRLGMTDAVTFRHLPPAERSQMAEILAGSSLLVALSSYEAHPVGIMEALALGLPVLGCDVAGIGDLVEDGLVQGIDVAAEPAQVAAAMVDLLVRNESQPHTVPAGFELPTWEGATEALAQVYREVAAGTRRPLRIAQIITTLTTGGAERQLQSLVSHSEAAHRTIALYEGGTVADGMRADGAVVDVLGMAGLRKLVAIPRLAARLRRMRPDAVHVHLLSGQLWGIPAARLAGIRTIISTEHSLMDDSIENRPLTPTLRLIYRALESMVTRTVAVSATTRTRLTRWGVPADRISVVDNGIDFAGLTFSASARRARRAEFGISERTVLLGAVGRLEPVKRFPALLEAVAPTLEPGVRELIIVGAGPLLPTLRARADELGVGDCVHLTGPRADVPALLSAMDVLISPCRDETFGMAVLEGLGAGLPVVYAQCPALDELGERPPWAFELPSATGSDSGSTAARSAAGPSTAAESAATRSAGTESAAIRTAVQAALDSVTPGERCPLPAVIAQAYGIGRTAGSLDRLYQELVDQAPRGRALRRPPGWVMTRLVLASRGDALTPFLFRSLRERFPIAGELDVDLTPTQRYLTAAGTFRPSRTAWVERFYKSTLAYRFRSRNAGRQLRAVGGFDAVVQVHALFEVPQADSVLYIDCTHRQSAAQWPQWNPLTGTELTRWYQRERATYHQAQHLFAFSEPTRRSLIDEYGVAPDRVTTTGAGVNLDQLPELTAGPSIPTILFIGNDFVRKGGLVLLEAFRVVRAAVPGVRLQLVGTDPRIRPQEGVEVLGRINDRQTIESLYRQASVFALPSYFDPFPLVLLEAMAFGLPTVASTSCGIPEIVQDGRTGTLVPAGDVDALARALIATLSDPTTARRQGAAGRTRVEQLYTWDAVVDRMVPALRGSSLRSTA